MSQRRHLGWVRRVVYLVAVLAAATTMVAALTSMHGWQVVPLLPILQAFAVAFATYPLLAGLLSVIERAWPVTDERSLFLRGD